MDLETFANHITNLGKKDFDVLCRIVLNDVLNLCACNVDGKGDGGTDFIDFNVDGSRTKVAYQLTTQKTDIERKAYIDAKKAISQLGVNRFFFFTTYNLSEAASRKLEISIESELGVPTSVYQPKVLSEFIIQHHLVRKFYELTGVVDGTAQSKATIDYLEMALHTYTFLSNDARNLKSQMYDDTMLYILSDTDTGKKREDLIEETVKLLQLSKSKKSILNGRIDSLMQKGFVNSAGSGFVVLSDETAEDISLRKTLYNSEQSTFYSAQVDLLKDYKVEWNNEDSKQSSVWIANAFINQQISGLQSAGAEISNPLFKNVRKNGLEKLKSHLLTKKNVTKDNVEEIIKKMITMASTHPLVVKIVRASVYISLEGTKPLAAAKSLGVNSWDEMNLLVEPTVGIPHICSLQYKGQVNSYFDNAIYAIKRAKELGVKLLVPYNYMKECAGHLLLARKYDGIDLKAEEMQYSKNAFVANYYALKSQNITMPSSFLDYLATFSPAIKTEHLDKTDWIREITTDIQSMFLQSGIEFLEIPLYEETEYGDIKSLYEKYLSKYYHKSSYLIVNDVVALKCTNERVLKNNEHWMILTYDNSLIKVSAESFNNVWINNPYNFMDMTELTKELPDSQFCALVHSFAQYSEKTLSIGARIIDRIVYYASDNMQEWQFKQELETLKNDLIKASVNKNMDYVDSKTDEFLQKHGIIIEDEDTATEADIQNDSVV
jgi:hypothetical protein